MVALSFEVVHYLFDLVLHLILPDEVRMSVGLNTGHLDVRMFVPVESLIPVVIPVIEEDVQAVRSEEQFLVVAVKCECVDPMQIILARGKNFNFVCQ